MARTPPVVVHCHGPQHDGPDFVYIGRPSKLGNPYHIGRDGDQATVIAKYRRHLARRPDLLAALPELTGKRLGCWCKPAACHGDVLVAAGHHYVGQADSA